jgi:hypothetical protein
MDKVSRAFCPKEQVTLPLTIDKTALSHLKDVASEVLRESPTIPEPMVIALLALHLYIARHDLTPQFEVKL